MPERPWQRRFEKHGLRMRCGWQVNIEHILKFCESENMKTLKFEFHSFQWNCLNRVQCTKSVKILKNLVPCVSLLRFLQTDSVLRWSVAGGSCF